MGVVMYGTCVVNKTDAFTLFDDYEINDLTVKADNGDTWYLHDMGDFSDILKLLNQ